MIQGKDNILQERNPRGDKRRWDPEHKGKNWPLVNKERLLHGDRREDREDGFKCRPICRFNYGKMGESSCDNFYFLDNVKSIIIR